MTLRLNHAIARGFILILSHTHACTQSEFLILLVERLTRTFSAEKPHPLLILTFPSPNYTQTTLAKRAGMILVCDVGSNMVLLRMRSKTCYIFFISSRKPNRRVTCGLWWKLGQVPRVTNFSSIQNRLPRAQRAEKPYELTNASRRRGESVLKDFLFSALGVPRWWWRVSSHEWLFDPRTHAHSMHAGRMQVYSPLKKWNVRSSCVRGTDAEKKEKRANAKQMLLQHALE